MRARRLSIVATAAVAAAATAAVVRSRRRRYPGRTLIISPRQSTFIADDGSVHSVQSAEVQMRPDDLDRMWTASNLENLGRTYWRFLNRATLGLVRVIYGEDERRVILLCRPLTLLRFTVPDYEFDGEHGRVTWWIRDGLLVARPGHGGTGKLSLLVSRQGTSGPTTAMVHVQVEVANFYPSILSGFSVLAYELTQSFVHVLLTHAFLRSLAKLDLAQSTVGALAEAAEGQSSRSDPAAGASV